MHTPSCLGQHGGGGISTVASQQVLGSIKDAFLWRSHVLQGLLSDKAGVRQWWGRGISVVGQG